MFHGPWNNYGAWNDSRVSPWIDMVEVEPVFGAEILPPFTAEFLANNTPKTFYQAWWERENRFAELNGRALPRASYSALDAWEKMTLELRYFVVSKGCLTSLKNPELPDTSAAAANLLSRCGHYAAENPGIMMWISPPMHNDRGKGKGKQGKKGGTENAHSQLLAFMETRRPGGETP